MLSVEALDHIVLIADDVERSVAWYRDLLGLEVLRFDDWREGRVPFPSRRINETTILDVVHGARSGLNVHHFCLTTAAADLDALRQSGDFDVVDGPVRVWWARGYGTSLYVADPDGNTVELRSYPPQPDEPSAAAAGRGEAPSSLTPPA